MKKHLEIVWVHYLLVYPLKGIKHGQAHKIICSKFLKHHQYDGYFYTNYILLCLF